MSRSRTPRKRTGKNGAITRMRSLVGTFRSLPLRTQVLSVSGGLTLLGLILVSSLVLLVHQGLLGPLPNYTELKNIRNHTASQVYAEDGVLLGKYYIQNRLHADFDEISPHVIQALVATEDARFFEHTGIDYRAWLRVLFRTVLMGDESGGGGSTLSQQLAKNLYPRRKYLFGSILVNKVREMFVARRLENLYTKEELLNLYLNTVSFSENSFGVKVAARRFFNRSPSNLTPDEAAVLVAMLKGPTAYNPVTHPERSFQRRNLVLGQMARYGYLSEERLEVLKAKPLGLDYRPEGQDEGLATYFREHLRTEVQQLLEGMKKEDGSSYNLYTDGLKIYTTLNSTLQSSAEWAVSKHMASLQATFDAHWKGRQPWRNQETILAAIRQTDRYRRMTDQGFGPAQIDSAFREIRPMTIFEWAGGTEKVEMSPLDSVQYYLTLLNAGFLAIDPESWEVKAWVGGIDHRFFKYDHVYARRQVGSTFKPIVFAAALQKGYRPCDYFENVLTTYDDFDGWTPENADGQYGGFYSMEGALCHSVNTVTIDLLWKTGLDTVREMARGLGLDGGVPAVPAIGLGAVDASLWEMVQVYATIANHGLRRQPVYLKKIETADGRVLIDRTGKRLVEEERVLSEEDADLLVQMLTAVVDSGTARRLRWEFGLQQDLAGKTGTTQNQADGWFLGISPRLVAGVWVGGSYPEVRFRTLDLGQGANTALPIFGHFLSKAQASREFRHWTRDRFPEPVDSLKRLLDCPMYLNERPYALGGPERGSGLQNLLQDILQLFGKHEPDMDTIRIQEKQPEKPEEEELSERSRQVSEANERLERKRERKEKRKAFWDRVLGREEK